MYKPLLCLLLVAALAHAQTQRRVFSRIMTGEPYTLECYLPQITNGPNFPTWSPDGKQIAFVSTQYEGRFHIFVWTRDSVHRITEDHDSGLPRYYYSVYDHYLSPVWSSDGKEMLWISNRGHVYGTGGIWRDGREIHSEETTWKTRPDW